MRWRHRPTWQKSGIVVLCLYLVLQLTVTIFWTIVLTTNIDLECVATREKTICFPFWWSLLSAVNIVPFFLLKALNLQPVLTSFPKLMIASTFINSVVYFSIGAFIGWLKER